jgi:hypothetical protein
LNGRIAEIFKNWLENYFPDKFEKVWNQIQNLHQGKVNDSTWGQRMKGQALKLI